MRRSSTLESQRIEFESMQCPGGILLLEGGGCQLFHHPLLTKSVFSAIGRIRVLRIDLEDTCGMPKEEWVKEEEEEIFLPPTRPTTRLQLPG